MTCIHKCFTYFCLGFDVILKSTTIVISVRCFRVIWVQEYMCTMDLKSTYLVLFNLNEVNICDQLTNLTWLFISTVACSLLVDQALAIFVDLLSWGTYFPAFSRSFPSVPSQCLFCYIVIFPEYMAYPGPISFTVVVWWRASWVTPTVLRLRLYLAPVFQEHLYLAFVLWRAGFF